MDALGRCNEALSHMLRTNGHVHALMRLYKPALSAVHTSKLLRKAGIKAHACVRDGVDDYTGRSPLLPVHHLLHNDAEAMDGGKCKAR